MALFTDRRSMSMTSGDAVMNAGTIDPRKPGRKNGPYTRAKNARMGGTVRDVTNGQAAVFSPAANMQPGTMAPVPPAVQAATAYGAAMTVLPAKAKKRRWF